jgi:acyl-CoA reductase-like NAD-dependent aldehyde dehydrogenase
MAVRDRCITDLAGGYIHTRDLKCALRVCEAMQTGMVGLN